MASALKIKMVKINSERGHGGEVFEVLQVKNEGTKSEEFLLRRLTGGAGAFWIYSAHTYSDRESRSATFSAIAAQQKKNQMIGLKNKPS